MKKRKKKKSRKGIFFVVLCLISIICISIYLLDLKYMNHVEEYTIDQISIQHKFLTPNPYSRSQKPLKRVKGIVIHYTANPGSSAKNNRNYFENLKDTQLTKASSHFIIGLKGEVIQCIPLNEIAYASNNRNNDTIAIECCHPDSTGKFNKKTYQSLQTLVKALMETYHLDKSDIIRHYDVTGKICPKYFVDYPQAWQDFLNSLDD